MRGVFNMEKLTTKKLMNVVLPGRLVLVVILTSGTFGCAWLASLFSSVPSREDAIQSLEEKMLNEKNPLVFMNTSEGDMILEIYADRAPKTAANFIDLATGLKSFVDPKTNKSVQRPYYDGLIFHRVIPNFMLQGGDIMGNGTGGPGYKFEDEISAKALGLDVLKVKESRFYDMDTQKVAMKELNINSRAEYDKNKNQLDRKMEELREMTVEALLEKAGYQFDNALKSVKMLPFTVAMANSGPNTNGSQFFINLVTNPHLDGKHTVFGKLLKGRSIAEKIAKIPTKNDKPTKDVVIKKVVLIK